MFSWATDASKAALVQLATRLKRGGFKVLDAQFITPHLEQFGAQTLPRRIFQALLGLAVETHGDFRALPVDTKGAELLEILRPNRA
jgi:leucyl/phenylalanyl-tRNA---protein transferase